MNRPATPQANARVSTAHVRDYWIVVLKRLPIVLFLTAIGAGLAFYITKKQTPLFRAQATVEMVLPRAGPRSSADYLFAPSVLRDANYLNTQLRKLEMPATLRRALETQKVTSRPDLVGLTLPEVVKMHQGRVTARQRRGQYLVDVSVMGTRADILDDVTNALVRYFREEQRNETQRRIDARRTELEEKSAGLRSSSRVAGVARMLALEQGGFTDGTFLAEYERRQEDLRKFIERKSDRELQIIEDTAANNAFNDALAAGAGGPESLSQHPRVLSHPALQVSLARIADMRARLDEYREAGLGEGSREVEGIKRGILRAETRRKELQDAFVRQFVVDFAGQGVALERLKAAVDERQRQLSDATRVKAAVDEDSATIARLDEDWRAAQRELEILGPAALGVADAVTIVETAREPNPGAPVSPNKTLNLILGTLMGLLAGVGIAFVLEYLDDTIQTKDDLEKITDVALLGVIPRIEGRSSDTQAKDLYAFRQPKSTVSEAFRGVRTALTMRAHGTRNRVLALTSAGPREGKSTTVINLATVLAYASRRTLIIDADLRKPRVHKSFGIDNVAGLTNVIVGDVDPREHCVATDVPGVDVLPSGPIPPNPSELLGSERMRDVITALREHYDHIIIDTPPIGAVTDAAVLGTIVDGVVLVVHAGKTRAGIVQRGLEQMRYISAPIEGVILNNLQVKSRYYPGYYNYYYYYSYYGTGKTRGRKTPRKPAADATGSSSSSGDDSPSA